MKRMLLLLIITLFLVLSCAYSSYAESSLLGDGTQENPYQIHNSKQLDLLHNEEYLDKCFVLMQDIYFDASDFAVNGEYYNDGLGWLPFGVKTYIHNSNRYFAENSFTGIFDGNGHAIHNLVISLNTTDLQGDISIALFSSVEGTVKNLGLVDCDISLSGNDYMKYYVAGFAGTCKNATISNCYNASNISSILSGVNCGAATYTAGSFASGIVGEATSSTIDGCYNSGTIISKIEASDKSIHCTHSSGIAYLANMSYVSNCFNSGTISAFTPDKSSGSLKYASGIVISMLNNNYNGSLCGGISYCYNAGKIFPNGNYTADILISYSNSGIYRCYQLEQSYLTYSYGEAFSPEEMSDQNNFIGFDFSSTWIMDENPFYSFPQLQSCPYVEPTLEGSCYSQYGYTFDGIYYRINGDGAIDVAYNQYVDSEKIIFIEYDSDGKMSEILIVDSAQIQSTITDNKKYKVFVVRDNFIPVTCSLNIN